MKTVYRSGLLIVTAGACLLTSSLAQAEPRHDKRGDHKPKHSNSRYHSDDDRDGRWGYSRPARVVVIDNRDRHIVRDYYSHQNLRDMPMRYSRPYIVGAPLPHDVRYRTVPRGLLRQMQPTPDGYQYVRVDNDILLMTEATRFIVDAIRL